MASQRNRFKFLVSACLAGVNCTYNAKNNLVPAIRKLFLDGSCILVCPEVMGGLGSPRSPAEIIAGGGYDVLCGKAGITTRSGKDITKACILGTRTAIRLAKKYKIKKAILKTRSPCCGIGKIYDGTFTKALRKGDGVLAAALIEHGIKVYGEKDLKKRVLAW